jgi:hypothetical protein
VLAPVPHRQYVFTIPRLLRPLFARRRTLLGKLCNIIERIFDRAYVSARRGARQGMILFVQTFGDLANFNPHIHVLAADGAFDACGGFSVLPPVPRKLLEPSFRKGLLALLRCEGLVSGVLAERMLAWRHTGFSVHNSVRVRARDTAGRRRLAQYMLRAPFSLEKMSYDPQSCTVIYRSHTRRRSVQASRANPDLPPRSRYRLNPLREGTTRLAASRHCAGHVEGIDCHVVFCSPIAALDATSRALCASLPGLSGEGMRESWSAVRPGAG